MFSQVIIASPYSMVLHLRDREVRAHGHLLEGMKSLISCCAESQPPHPLLSPPYSSAERMLPENVVVLACRKANLWFLIFVTWFMAGTSLRLASFPSTWKK